MWPAGDGPVTARLGGGRRAASAGSAGWPWSARWTRASAGTWPRRGAPSCPPG